MKHFYKLLTATVLISGSMTTPPSAYAVEEVSGYIETFDGFDASRDDCAPAYWLHNVDKGNVKDQLYISHQTGGHDDGAYVELSSQCNPYYMTDDCLVTLPVKGTVTFWVKGASTSSVLEVKKATLNGSSISLGSSIKPSDFKMSIEWQKVTIEVPDYTRISLLLRKGGAFDDFSASFADKSELVLLSASGFSYPDKSVADASGKAVVPVTFNLTNAGTSTIDASTLSFKAGLTNYLASSLTSEFNCNCTLPQGVTEIKPGESVEVSMSIEYILSDPNVSESKTVAIQDNLTNSITKIGTFKVESLRGVLEAKNGSTKVESGKKVEFGLLRSADNTLKLQLSNTGNHDITVTEITLPDGWSTANATPFTISNNGEATELQLTLPAGDRGWCNDVTLTYNDGVTDSKTAAYTMSCAILGEGKWLEDFQNCTTPNLPDGWMVGEKEFRTTKDSYETNVYATGSSYNRSALVSPKMTLNPEGSITIRGLRYNSTDKDEPLFTLYISPDRKTWTEVGGIICTQPEGRLPFNTFVAGKGTSKEDWVWYTFSLKKIEAGDYYVKFETNPFKIDDIFGMEPAVVEHDFLISSIKAPAKGEVNAPIEVTGTVTNMTGTADGAYTLTLLENGKEVAVAEGVEIEAYKDTEISLQYMPHNAGDVELALRLDVDGLDPVMSDAVSITIAEEDNAVRLAGKDISKYDTNFVGAKFNKLQFYVPADATGLNQDDEFSSIAFSVYNSSSYSDITIPYTLWIEKVDAVEAFTDAEKIDFELPDAATAVAEGSYTLKGGESSKDAPVLFEIPLKAARKYSGGAYRVTLEMNMSSSSYSFNVGKYAAGSNIGRYYGKNSETGTYPGAKLISDVPVVYFCRQGTPANVKGLLHDGTAPIAGATATLVEETQTRAAAPDNCAISYSATTAADGTFTIPVVKSTRDYRLYLDVPGSSTIIAHPDLVSPNGKDVDLGRILVDLTTGVETVPAEVARVCVSNGEVYVSRGSLELYVVDGTLVGRAAEGERLTPGSGVYVARITVDGKATSVKIAIR